MPHAITALILPGAIDTDAVHTWDLVPVPLNNGLTLFHLTHYYTAYWQAAHGVTDRFDLPRQAPGLFPSEGVIATIAADLSARTDPTFALVFTDYFGGVGEQWAAVSNDGRAVRSVNTINEALRAIGIIAAPGSDEFDTTGLPDHRSTPDYLERYVDLCDELGV
ncbi:hypothetical protein [Nocardia sp. NPDC051463]|uniref:hypothetical protein n=1 Tax=Nocardia sp. NPDC051463 TaxID=3154845 RepID=UPI00344FFD1E